MRLVFLGAPGAGKGTQARILAEHFNIEHVSTGDLLRREMAGNTEIGVSVRELMDKGSLVPDDIVMSLIKHKLEAGNYVLDGYPRTLAQARELDALNEQLGMPIDKALYVIVPDDVIVERMSGRLTCTNCGTIFHTVFHPPKSQQKCDKCGGALIQREDDKPRTVEKRLARYHEVTEPIIGYYRDRGMLLEIDGIGEMREITQNIINGVS